MKRVDSLTGFFRIDIKQTLRDQRSDLSCSVSGLCRSKQTPKVNEALKNLGETLACILPSAMDGRFFGWFHGHGSKPHPRVLFRSGSMS